MLITVCQKGCMFCHNSSLLHNIVLMYVNDLFCVPYESLACRLPGVLSLKKKKLDIFINRKHNIVNDTSMLFPISDV